MLNLGLKGSSNKNVDVPKVTDGNWRSSVSAFSAFLLQTANRKALLHLLTIVA